MSGTGTEIIYWDTCIFYAVFKALKDYWSLIDNFCHNVTDCKQAHDLIVAF